MEILIPVVVVVALAFGALGAWIASQKNRDGGEGFILGLLFGPIGAIIEAVLPTVAQPPPAAPSGELTEEEQDRVQEQRRKQAAQEEAQRLAAARERERWRKTQEEALRRAEEARREARERSIRETKQALAHDVQAIWRWIPDWVKMASVGLVLGAIVCVPVIAYMMMTGLAQVMPEDTQPQVIAMVPQAAPANTQTLKAPVAAFPEGPRTPSPPQMTSLTSEKSSVTPNPWGFPWGRGPRFKAGDHVALYGKGLESIGAAKDLDALKVFALSVKSGPGKGHDKTAEAYERMVGGHRLVRVPLGSIWVVTETHGMGGEFNTAYAVQSLREPNQVVFVPELWMIPATQEVENLSKPEERVQYLKQHPDPYQGKTFLVTRPLEKAPQSSSAATGNRDDFRALEHNIAAVFVQKKMESEVVVGDLVTGVTEEYDEERGFTAAVLTLKLNSKTLFIKYTTRGGPRITAAQESTPIEAFLYGPALPLDLARVVFSGTPLPEYTTSPCPITYQAGHTFVMHSGELYNLIRQEKTIPITDGINALDELRVSAQAEIERFLQRIQGKPAETREETSAEGRDETKGAGE